VSCADPVLELVGGALQLGVIIAAVTLACSVTRLYIELGRVATRQVAAENPCTEPLCQQAYNSVDGVTEEDARYPVD